MKQPAVRLWPPMLCVLGALLILPACPALGLTSEQILVVANATSSESVELAKLYIQARGISANRLLLVKTTTGQDISRAHYQRDILLPIARHLVDNDLVATTRSICLIWGMPIKIAVVKPTGELAKVVSAYKAAATRGLYRMYTNYKLLGTVAMEFPEPKTIGLTPIGRLFEPRSIPGTESPPKREKLEKDIRYLIKIKTKAVRSLADPAQRRIAWRQLMAVQLDVFGLEGLLEYIAKNQPEGAPETASLVKQRDQGKQELSVLDNAPASADNVRAALALAGKVGGINFVVSATEAKTNMFKLTDASVDSELALLWWGNKYALPGMLDNPMNWQVAKRTQQAKLPPVIMTARIDGPTAQDARRMILDSVATERTGLSGKFYIDAGGKYKPYDQHLRALHELLQSKTKLDVVIDHDSAVFQPGSCDDAALYVGWYSLRKYIPAFTWNRGAVGWHIASFEAVHLRDPNSQEWCPQMIQNGVAATVGSVDEPYLSSFPLPEHFFGLLLSGKYTLAECYWRTVPNLSWRMMLIGDPLYNPFRNNPQLEIDDLPPGLAR